MKLIVWFSIVWCFCAFGSHENIPDDVKKKMNLNEILERISEIDGQSKLNDIIDKILMEDKNLIKKRKSKTIILDAGHGGKDPGTQGILGTIEKNVTLQYVFMLKDILQNAGYTVRTTRSTDVYLTLKQRRKFSQDAHGTIMISIHADSAESIDAKGLSVYTLSEEASDATAQMLANAHDLGEDISFKTTAKDIAVKNTLIDIVQKATVSKSEYFARVLVNNAVNHRLFVIPKTHRRAGFAVLKMPDVPSALIELGFLSNPEEEILLKSPAYRSQMLKVIFQSIDEYFGIEN